MKMLRWPLGLLVFSAFAACLPAQPLPSRKPRLQLSQISLQQREALLAASKPLDFPFVRMKLEKGFPTKTTVVPGDVLPIDLPNGFHSDQSVPLFRKEGRTWIAKGVPVYRAKQKPVIGKTPSSWVDVEGGIQVPQLPGGDYTVAWSEGGKSGPTTTVRIRPTLSVAAPDTSKVGRSFHFTVQLVGPVESPPELVDGKPVPGGPIKVDVGIEDAARVEHARSTSAKSVRVDSAGIARFDFDATSIGECSATFAAAGFRSCKASVDILERRVPLASENPDRPFNILVIGDSIQWGQGLLGKHKMAEILKEWIGDQTKRAVKIVRLAHSGATIVVPEGQQGAEDNDPLPGEFPVFYPTINAQLDQAIEMFEGQTVDLVVMDGGINDIDVTQILNPLNSMGSTIQDRCETFGHQKLGELLGDLSKSFPFRKATVLVSGYFPIVSLKSKPLLVSGLISLFVAATWPEEITKPAVVAAAFGTSLATVGIMSANCAAFNRAMRSAIDTAVSEANTGLLPGDNRIVAFHPGFDSDNAIFADETMLFAGVNDEVVDVRARAIERDPSLLVASPAGPVASMGHPTVEGEAVYANKMKRYLQDNPVAWDIDRSLCRFDVDLGGLRLAVKLREFGLPKFSRPDLLKLSGIERRGSVEQTVRVACRDRGTGKLVDALVFLDDKLVGHTNKDLKVVVDYSSQAADAPKPVLTVTRRGYLDFSQSVPWEVANS